MTTPPWLKTRNGRIATGGAAAAVIALVIVIVAVSSGDDGSDAAPTTSGPAATSTSIESSDGSSTAPSSSSSGTDSTTPGTATTTATVPSTTAGPPQTTIPPAPSSMVTVPDEGTVDVRDPIPTDEPGDFGTGLVIEITELTAVQGEATAPGEISGPSIRAVLSATNNSAEAINLDTMQVEITYGPEHSSGIELQAPDVSHFSGSLAPGASATGAYVFNVPADQRDLIQVVVRYSVDAPVIVFEGAGPAA
jgi:hypothetical protein